MRLALLGYFHETNTFATTPTDYSRFGLLRGDEIVREHGEAQSTVAGFLEVGRQPGIEVVPLMFANTAPSGMIAAEALERIAQASGGQDYTGDTADIETVYRSISSFF